MRSRNIEFTSPEADRKVMLTVSFFVMLLMWMFFVTLLVCMGRAAFSSETFVWDAVVILIFAALSVLSLVIIPIQLVRYVREWRSLR